MGEELDFDLVTPSRMIVPCPDLERVWFSEGRNSMFVVKKETFLWQIILLIAAVWNCSDTWNVPLSPNRAGLKGRGQVRRWLDVCINAISDVAVFFKDLHICSLWSLIRPGTSTPNANTPLLRMGICIWTESNVAPQSHLDYTHTHASAITM